MYMVLPECCSQQEKIVDKTQKITSSQVIHYYGFIGFILGQIYILLHLSDIHILKI